MDPRKIALIIVDMQCDFCKGGALAVQGADSLLKPINCIKKAAQSNGSLVFASRCWHPSNSMHFKDFVVHCVQNTQGADFHNKLDLNGVLIISKGMKPKEHGFSVFDGTSENGKPFNEILRGNQIELLLISGVALEYCDIATVRDARKTGYDVVVLEDAVRAFDPKKKNNTFHELLLLGAKILSTSEAIKKFFSRTVKK